MTGRRFDLWKEKRVGLIQELLVAELRGKF